MRVVVVLLTVLYAGALAQCTSDEFLLSRDGTTFLRVNTTSMYACNSQDVCAQLARGVQSLTLTGGSLTIANGNTVTLPDTSSTNELQTLALSSATLQIKNPDGTVQSSVTLPDVSVTNELQTLALSSATLQIKNPDGTVQSSVTLPDVSVTNELQTLAVSGASLQIKNPDGTVQSSVTLPDSSSTNEIQSISRADPNTLTLSGGNTINAPLPVAIFKLTDNAGMPFYCGANGGTCNCPASSYSGEGVTFSTTSTFGVKAAYNRDAGALYWDVDLGPEIGAWTPDVSWYHYSAICSLTNVNANPGNSIRSVETWWATGSNARTHLYIRTIQLSSGTYSSIMGHVNCAVYSHFPSGGLTGDQFFNCQSPTACCGRWW